MSGELFVGLYGDRRGLSHHVEAVIAFVMFIGFVLFVLIFVQPQDNNFLSVSLVDSVEYHLVEMASVDVTRLFVRVSVGDDVDVGDCVEFSIPSEVYWKESEGSFVRVAGSGSAVDSAYVNREFSVDLISEDDVSYEVIFSGEGGSDSLSGCEDVNSGDVEFGSVSSQMVISQRELEEMKTRYDGVGYDDVKRELGVPSVFDVAIVSDVVVMERDSASLDSEVFSVSFSAPVLLRSGDIDVEVFTIKVWR